MFELRLKYSVFFYPSTVAKLALETSFATWGEIVFVKR